MRWRQGSWKSNCWSFTARIRARKSPFLGPVFRIGRGEDCQLRPRSEMISRRHCEILVEEGATKVRDLGSRNGTFVNGERVKGERQLKTGDRLKMGPLEFEVQLAVSVGGKKKPKVKSVQEAAKRTVAAAGDDLDISGSAERRRRRGDRCPARADGHDLRCSHGRRGSGRRHDDQRGAEDQDRPGDEIVGRFSKTDKPMAESSRSAAADMLKQFFNRKP